MHRFRFTCVLHQNNSAYKVHFCTSAQRKSNSTVEHWKNIEAQREFFDKLAQKLNVNTFEDWYKVKYDDVVENGMPSTIFLN